MHKTLMRLMLPLAALVTSSAWSNIQAAERNWSYTYNSLGLIETADGPRTDVQDITTYGYDAQGHLTTVTNALGHVSQFSNFDTYGKPQSLTDANGVQTSLVYTPEGWLASISVSSSTTSFEYDAVGQVTKITRGDGSWLSYTWSAARRLTSVTNNQGETVEYDYDLMGNRTAQHLKDATGNLAQQSTWVYDELGRLLRSVGAAGQTNAYQYDLNDNPTVSTNPKLHSNTKAYDGLNRLVSSVDPLNGVTNLTYNSQDKITQVQDPRGVTTQYQYDGLGNLIQQISPDSGTTIFSHDAAGNVISKTDARGVVTTYTYDALNRLVGRQYPASPEFNAQYHYDMTSGGNKGIGRLTALQDASGVLGYTYDGRGNLIEQLRSIELASGDHYDRLGYAYDNADQLTRIDYPNGFSVLYQRNAVGQISQVQIQVGNNQPGSFASGISYLPFGPLKSLTWANGINLNRSYDQDYRLTQQVVGEWARNYTYDANGNVAAISGGQLEGENVIYIYDALDRLTGERVTGENVNEGSSTPYYHRDYTYDANGNRLSKINAKYYGDEPSGSDQTTYQYASNSNRLVQKDSFVVVSDAAGNLTQHAENKALEYDAQNRLSRVTSWGQVVATYHYNALGQRTHKNTNYVGVKSFIYDKNGQLLGEHGLNAQGQSAYSMYYIWLDNIPLGGIRIQYDEEGEVSSSSLFYLHTDHLNTPRLATDQSQEMIWHWSPDAFGAGRNNGMLEMNLRFPGQYYDAESGLYYNYFRDYDPHTGRYVESDPIGLAGGLNTYGYAEGNPLTYIDPTGELAFIPIAGWAARSLSIAGRIGAFSGPSNPTFLPPRGVAWNPGQGLTLPPLAPPMLASGSDNMCEPGEEPCEEEVKHCEQICENAMSDPNRQNVWGGSWNTCMMGCVSQRCGGNRAN
jgi:RHS repeat-associated protein